MVSQIGKILKSTGKIAKQLYWCKPIVAKKGTTLTKGQKAANSVFNTLYHSAMVTMNLSAIGCLTSLGFFINDVNKNSSEIMNKKSTIWLSKTSDASMGGAIGFMLGGPIGALIGTSLSLKTDNSLIMAMVAATEKDISYEETKNNVANWRKDTKNDIKETLKVHNSDNTLEIECYTLQTPEHKKAEVEFIKDVKDLYNNGKIGDYVTFPNLEGQSAKIKTNEQSAPIKAGDTIFKTENGFYIKSFIPQVQKVSIKKIGSKTPIELTVGEPNIAEENMKFLVGKKNNLVSVNQGDTFICKPDNTLNIKPFIPQTQIVSIRQIGTPTPVEYETGKTYTADKDTRFLVGQSNFLITVKAGQNFKVNADKTVEIIK